MIKNRYIIALYMTKLRQSFSSDIYKLLIIIFLNSYIWLNIILTFILLIINFIICV